MTHSIIVLNWWNKLTISCFNKSFQKIFEIRNFMFSLFVRVKEPNRSRLKKISRGRFWSKEHLDLWIHYNFVIIITSSLRHVSHRTPVKLLYRSQGDYLMIYSHYDNLEMIYKVDFPVAFHRTLLGFTFLNKRCNF